jgi:mRNA interferase MazF
MVRGEVFRLRAGRTQGRKQAGARYAVVVQADPALFLSTVLVAPTSTSAQATTFRPVIEVEGIETRVLVEQTTVTDERSLGRSAGRLAPGEMAAVDEALRLMLAL